MKKNTVSLLLAASALVFMAGCAGGAKNSAAQKRAVESARASSGSCSSASAKKALNTVSSSSARKSESPCSCSMTFCNGCI